MKTEERFVGFDTLKRAVSMVQVLGRYGLTEQMRRSGDSLSGVCPLHQGHNPTQFRYLIALQAQVKALVDARKSLAEVKAALPGISATLKMNTHIARYVPANLTAHVQKVYIELGGQPLPR